MEMAAQNGIRSSTFYPSLFSEEENGAVTSAD